MLCQVILPSEAFQAPTAGIGTKIMHCSNVAIQVLLVHVGLETFSALVWIVNLRPSGMFIQWSKHIYE